MKSFPTLAALLTCAATAVSEVTSLTLTRGVEMDRAEIYLLKPEKEPKAIMVFCPGHNGSGESFVKNKAWQNFAAEHDLMLCGLSFASPMKLTQQGRGYSYAGGESGKILLDGLDKENGGKELPLLFYGYSAGARFSTSFLAWKPSRVLSWCASGVGNWPILPDSEARIAPGIVACGEFDAGSYWSSLHFFQMGRERDYPWTWVSLQGIGHEHSDKLDAFVKIYFSHVLKERDSRFDKNLFDIATKRPVSTNELLHWKIFTSCLPSDRNLTESWLDIHHP